MMNTIGWMSRKSKPIEKLILCKSRKPRRKAQEQFINDVAASVSENYKTKWHTKSGQRGTRARPRIRPRLNDTETKKMRLEERLRKYNLVIEKLEQAMAVVDSGMNEADIEWMNMKTIGRNSKTANCPSPREPSGSPVFVGLVKDDYDFLNLSPIMQNPENDSDMEVE